MPNDSLDSLILNSVLKFAGKTAVQFIKGNETVSLTYEEVDRLSARARQCLASVRQDCSCGWHVGLCLPVTYSYPCLIYGILKAGFSFVPLDPMNGAVWNKSIIERLKIRLIFTDKNYTFLEEGSLLNNFKILSENIEVRAAYSCTCGTDVALVTVEDRAQPIAYSVQTSGTTAAPKVIKVPHSCIIPNITDLSALFQVEKQDVVLLSSAATFDPSVVEVFLALSNGAVLLIVDELVKKDPGSLLDVLFPSSGDGVTILQITPSLFQRWSLHDLQTRVFAKASKLRILAFGGEACPSQTTIRGWEIRSGVQIYNLYGISEVSCWAAVSRINSSGAATNDTTRDPNQCFTEPMSHTVLEVRNVDRHNIGQMFIGSDSRICLIDDEPVSTLTGSGTVFRPTGDLFQQVGDKYYFVGREQSRVKRQGARLCLKSVESAAESCSAVARAACVWQDSARSNSSGHLALFLQPRQHLTFCLEDFETAFKERCPQNAWPDKITVVQSMPLTKHGKTDERALLGLMTGRGLCEDPLTLFQSLWPIYTLNSKTETRKGFLSSGGTSFSAVQFVSELQRFTNIKYDFVLNLLRDVEFSECYKRFQNALNSQCPSEVDLTHHPLITIKKFKSSHSTKDNKLIGISGASFTSSNIKNDINLQIKIKWKYNLGKCVDASPVCAEVGGRQLAVVGSHSGEVAVLDCDSGHAVASISLPDRVESAACIDRSLECFVVGCYDACIYSFTIDGRLLWSYKTGDMIKSGVRILGSYVVCGSYDKHLYCLHIADGSLRWKQRLDGSVLARAECSNSVLLVATLVGTLSAHDLNCGSLIWSVKLYGPVFANFLIDSGRTIVADVQGTVHWISMENGHRELELKVEGNIFSGLVKDEECVMLGTTEGWLYRLSAIDSTVLWKVHFPSRLISAPLKLKLDSQERLESDSRVALIATSAGCVCIFNTGDGSHIASCTLPAQVFSSPVSPQNDSNLIIIGCRDDHVYCLQVEKSDQ